MKPAFILAFAVLSLPSARAQADPRDAAEVSFFMLILNAFRDHPGPSLLVLVGILLVIGALALWAVRRVKREALGYYDAGRTRWTGLRDRVRGRLDHRERDRPEGSGRPSDPEDPDRIRRIG